MQHQIIITVSMHFEVTISGLLIQKLTAIYVSTKKVFGKKLCSLIILIDQLNLFGLKYKSLISV